MMDPAEIQRNVAAALLEDLGGGDATAALIPEEQRAEARIVCREQAVLCGRPFADEVFRQLGQRVEIDWQAGDGDALSPEQTVCTLRGPARDILSGERTALNFLQTLSGTATLTREHVRLIAGSGTRLLDTRKTIPGLRLAQKYAVRCGGGHNHRVGLFDAILIKENHIAAAGGISTAVAAARSLHPDLLLEVEVENLQELREALDLGVKRILLDNMDLAMLRAATALNGGRAELEASGGITRDTLAEIAATGVDYISAGALTKDVKAIDFSMRFSECQ